MYLQGTIVLLLDNRLPMYPSLQAAVENPDAGLLGDVSGLLDDSFNQVRRECPRILRWLFSARERERERERERYDIVRQGGEGVPKRQNGNNPA